MIPRVIPKNHDSRQQKRARCFGNSWKAYRLSPTATGTRKDPLLPRAERRKMARAFARGAWRQRKVA